MKKLYTILSLFLFTFFALLLSSFENKEDLPNVAIRNRFLSQIKALELTGYKLEYAAKQLDEHNESKKQLIKNYFLARQAYKRVEMLSAYLQPQFTIDFINGAPLPKIERKVPELKVLEPKGFQPLDELLAEEVLDQQKIIALTKSLGESLAILGTYFNGVSFTDRQVFEAMRLQLIRLFTLGITGFDTPATGVPLEDALVVIKELNDVYMFYVPYLVKVDSALANQMDSLFQYSIDYLATNTNFDRFDRLTFLTNSINPLYDNLLKVHLALNIETMYEVSSVKKPINYLATNLFSNDFLNPYYYTNLQAQQDNESLTKLGKILFYDPLLSANGKRSCASCHHPGRAFTDGRAKSLAFNNDETVSRNSPTLVNAIYADRFFHDLRATNLEEQIEHVVLNDLEFHTDYAQITDKLAKSDAYQALFKKAFPSYEAPIFKYTLSMALSSYIISLRGFNAPFDKYVRGESTELSASAKNGFNLFMGKAACGTCHFAPVFNGSVPPMYAESESEVLGVPLNKNKEEAILDDDRGRAGAKRVKEASEIYNHSFKTVTVRNIELTAPYMHNGVYSTLEEVMDFYHAGGGAGLGFDIPNQTLPPDSLDLSEIEKEDLIAFMKSLTDTTGMTSTPAQLPLFNENTSWNNRKIGGEY